MKKRTLHERKIMLNFFSLFFKPPTFLDTAAYLDTSVLYVRAYGEMEIMTAARELASVD